METDSSEEIALLLGEAIIYHIYHALVQETREIGGCELMINWRKVKREVNDVADSLAKFSHSMRDSFVIFNIVPNFIVYSLERDVIRPVVVGSS